MRSKIVEHIDVPSHIRLVITDMDGTLYRKPRMVLYMMLKQWCHLGHLVRERKRKHAIAQQIVGGEQAHLPLYSQSSEDAAKWYRESYLPAMVQIIRRHYHVSEWVEPLLRECAERGVPVAVLSDYDAIEDKLQAIGLSASRFAALVSAQACGTLKPDVRLGEAVLQAVYTAGEAVAWKDVLIIGDSPSDRAWAERLGATFRQV